MKNRLLILGLIITLVSVIFTCSFAFIVYSVNNIPFRVESVANINELRAKINRQICLPILDDTIEIDKIIILYDYSFINGKQLSSYIIFTEDFTIGGEINSKGIINPLKRDNYHETVMFNEIAIYVFYEYTEGKADLSMLTIMNNHIISIASASLVQDAEEYYNENYPILMKIIIDTLTAYYDCPVW